MIEIDLATLSVTTLAGAVTMFFGTILFIILDKIAKGARATWKKLRGQRLPSKEHRGC